VTGQGPLPPGSTIGVIGGGQLGRMLALEARRMGYRVGVVDPTPDCPAAQVADFHIVAPLSDVKAVRELASRSDVVTIETEHIAIESMHAAEAVKPVRPSSKVLANIHDRLAQKTFLQTHGFPQPAFAKVDTREDLEAAARTVGVPAVLKSRRGGYDGKGQSRVMEPGDLEGAWERINRAPCIYEAFVPFRMEVSVILARGVDGTMQVYPVAENVHRNGILHTTRAPARVPDAVAARAQEIAKGVAEALGHVGVIAVEMFVTRDDEVLVNEIAPRTHNSSHFTFGACSTSQFEQHARAVLGLPLGDPSLLTPVVMVNILGDAWKNGEPDWMALLAHPELRLHLYGKKDMKPGRKVGHFLLLDADTDRSLARADGLLAALSAGAKRPE